MINYMWVTKKSSLDSDNVLCKLPHPLRTEIAVQVHLETLKRVQIFADGEPGLLKEIVLKLRSQVNSPGDYICQKGEPGKEMYIVSSGRLQLMQDDSETVIATLQRKDDAFVTLSVFPILSIPNKVFFFDFEVIFKSRNNKKVSQSAPLQEVLTTA